MSVVWRWSVSRRVHYGRFHCMSDLIRWYLRYYFTNNNMQNDMNFVISQLLTLYRMVSACSTRVAAVPPSPCSTPFPGVMSQLWSWLSLRKDPSVWPLTPATSHSAFMLTVSTTKSSVVSTECQSNVGKRKSIPTLLNTVGQFLIM